MSTIQTIDDEEECEACVLLAQIQEAIHPEDDGAKPDIPAALTAISELAGLLLLHAARMSGGMARVEMQNDFADHLVRNLTRAAHEHRKSLN